MGRERESEIEKIKIDKNVDFSKIENVSISKYFKQSCTFDFRLSCAFWHEFAAVQNPSRLTPNKMKGSPRGREKISKTILRFQRPPFAQ